ncbi:MAG TPA: beta-ketoacyl-[acyl-carrier-protein] synthase family protein, partial [Planctomycetota bacterium]|nr:beta-ketoacyl-[acyl-carrier-protein] synthase family protein [Planctomycetota bacterium]
GAEVRGVDVDAELSRRPDLKGTQRNTLFAVMAAEEAFADSGLAADDYDPERLGVYLGAGEGVPDSDALAAALGPAWNGSAVDIPAYMRKSFELNDARRELEQEPNLPCGHVAIAFNAQGPNCGCLTACAASNQALGEALELIRHDDADVMISGGAHSMLHPLGLTGFCLLTALSTMNENPKGASRPFDARRDGFLLGEGAAMLILEELEHARARGARIHAEVVGYGSSADAFRLTDSHENGRGAIACMTDALRDAGLEPDAVDYINAHGTSTKVNDRIETLAVKQVFGERAYRIPVSATKSMTGHLIAAAGATETIICVKVIQEGIVPPTINQEEPDPECDLDYVPNQARKHPVDVAMTNSFGFGGQNISLLLRRYDDA